ncbi:MAG: phosphodiester glycosidase family protein [Treponema sp.]|jgi:hypothetical protein|nr:phosphodiester glycosidase family protein [Treponema sp.]
MRNPPPSSTGKRRRFNGNCLKKPEKAAPNIKSGKPQGRRERIHRQGGFLSSLCFREGGVFFPYPAAGLIILAILVSLGACTTLSPVTSAPEGKLQKTAAPEDIRPQWQPFAPETTGGIDYYGGKIIKPRLEFRALRINLSEPGLRITVSGGAFSAEQPPGTTPSVRVSSFVRGNGLLAGINAAPFAPLVTAKEGIPLTPAGIAVAEGVLVSPPNPRFDALVFYYGGGAAVVNQGELGNLERIQNAVGGFYRILEGNRLPRRVLKPAEARSAPRHPRSAAGLSAEGNFLYLLVIDGRQLKSIGATEAETGIILRQLGASEGINFDGGGSTALALRFPDGVVRTVNTPIHGGIPGRERAVASCLGIGIRQQF